MHELAIVESVVTAVDERVGPARVTCVRLQIGQLAGVVPDALRFCFDLCTRGTALEGATLEIDEVDGHGRCRQCGGELAMTTFLDLCPCGSADLEVLTGNELRIKNVEVH
ncbi:MAG TPA: hydrogenase maturation nickel metallochaperone HypA [Polyangia bacterium]|jgi:hydrogenase nickel incorporation protein HypA/HybF|nr:hydrogenase maturation nickel metallochaperone HypA [Polyangia bacterium]